MLYVIQVEGKRVELAKQAREAVVNGKIELAEKIYMSVTGEKFSEHHKKLYPAEEYYQGKDFVKNGMMPSLWLLINMPEAIRTFIEDKYYPKFEYGYDNQKYYQILKSNAEKAYGGKWEVRYEY